MSKYIELIDKYRIEQSGLSEYGDDMNPPNYIWTDNTGELVRCGDCEAYKPFFNQHYCDKSIISCPLPDDYCSRGGKNDSAEIQEGQADPQHIGI